MPSASKELQDEMEQYYGTRADDAGPIRWLKKQGFKLTDDWCWVPPERVKDYSDLTTQK